MTFDESIRFLLQQHGQAKTIEILSAFSESPEQAAELTLDHGWLGGDATSLRMIADQIAARRRGE
jgi:hypothetical protein